MKTKSLLLAVLTLAGCVTPFQAPADVTHIRLDRGDSPVVRVEKIWLERKDGVLAVKGFVTRRAEDTDTTGTHLDITLFDGSGRVLRASMDHFNPRQIVHARRHPDDASYQVVLDPLPAATVRILVQAHEGDHL